MCICVHPNPKLLFSFFYPEPEVSSKAIPNASPARHADAYGFTSAIDAASILATFLGSDLILVGGKINLITCFTQNCIVDVFFPKDQLLFLLDYLWSMTRIFRSNRPLAYVLLLARLETWRHPFNWWDRWPRPCSICEARLDIRLWNIFYLLISVNVCK